MTRLSNIEIDEIVRSCLDLYNKLPKNGKPIDKEWTVLSCVVQYNKDNSKHEVVALGTGSKCVGASKLSPIGDILNDSHAEVFARRGFLLYLYDQLNHVDHSIFTQECEKFKLNKNLEFLFYSSQLPCGDASIIPKSGDMEHFGEVLTCKRKLDENISDTAIKKIKINIDDIHRTGAKCLPDAKQDPKSAGINYHLLGQVRTKPGRGDRTLSVTCSDKMARWAHVGIQGSLLDMILHEPIYIKHFIFGASVPYSEESLNRAFLKRSSESFRLSRDLQFYQSNLIFPSIKKDDSLRAAPGSIVWAKTCSRNLDVAVQGRKIGVTKKKTASSNNYLCISKFKFYESFQRLIQKNKHLKHIIFGDDLIDNIPYNEMKSLSKRYREHWSDLKSSFFKTWTQKPDIWNFRVNIS